MTVPPASPKPTPPPEQPPEWLLFQKLLPPRLLNDLDPKPPQAAYTPYVVTWLMVFQRLKGNASLGDAVAEFLLRFPPSALPDCKRTRERSLSANTGAYSQARTDLDLRVLSWAAENAYDTLVEAYPPSWHGRRAFLIDGTTLRLQPTRALGAAFPPASNQHGASPWPILHLAVAHELASGLALVPQFGPMYGPDAVAEIALAKGLLGRLPEHSILLADRNFGIFAFAHAGVKAGHDVLLRLTGPRFGALRKKARPVGAGKWELTWRPSRWDRGNNPELPDDAVVKGWLYEVRVSDRLTLWLFSTLDAPGGEVAGLYKRRIDVETDIRDVKITLELDGLLGKSVGMVEKELVVGVLAYNLASQVRRLAAARLGVEPRRLSFAGVWGLVKAFLGGLPQGKTEAQWQADFEVLLRAAGQRKLPNRKPGRQYPREVIPRRRKFPERKRPKPAAPTEATAGAG
jgi:hypothetical protein